MKIHEYYYNEVTKRLYVEFSTKEDSDSYYRIIEVPFKDVEFYSPTIIVEEDLIGGPDKYFIVDFLNEYFKDNDLPEEITL
jgi:hypothetical protein